MYNIQQSYNYDLHSVRLCSQRLKFLHMVHEDNCIALRSSGSIYKHGMNIY